MKRTGLELSVERDLPSGETRAGGRVRLTARFEFGGEAPSSQEVAAALSDLSKEIDLAMEALPPARSAAPRSDRPLAELIEAYHPRQAELVLLLAEEGELTPREAELLRGYVERPAALPAPAGPAPTPEEFPITDRPIAALPLANDRTPTQPRPVPQLLNEYRIESLKQAGAVRGRRQISYEEYMALKRHFADREPKADEPTVPSR